MLDKWADIFSLMIVGGIAIRIITNPNSQKTLGTAFNGFAQDTKAALGS